VVVPEMGYCNQLETKANHMAKYHLLRTIRKWPPRRSVVRAAYRHGNEGNATSRRGRPANGLDHATNAYIAGVAATVDGNKLATANKAPCRRH